MGNSQSELSDDEDGQKYDFHEKVLQDAENDLNLAMSSPSTEEEQYFSADEGDSVRSITPPRTRPESSSGEDFSDSDVAGDSQDIDDDRGGSSFTEQPTSSKNIKAAPKLNLRSKRSCGQCNVSTFQEHDSIGPELEVARRGGRKSANTSQNKSANVSLSVSSALPHTSKNHSYNSPFKPIPSDNTSVIPDSPNSKPVSPKSNPFDRCSKRKRLGYLDSSESDDKQSEKSESAGNEKRKTSNKKVKNSTSSTPALVSTTKKVTQQSIEDSDSQSENSDSEKAASRSKRTPPVHKRLQGKQYSTKQTQVYPGLNEDNVDVGTEGSPIGQTASQNSEDGENSTYAHIAITTSSLIKNTENSTSLKMGNKYARNPLGKVVPISQIVPLGKKNESCNETPEASRPPIVLQPTNPTAISTVVNFGNSAFVSMQPSGVRRPLPPTHQEPGNAIKASTAAKPSSGKDESSSPFKGVVLTPTKTTSSNDSRLLAKDDSTAGSNSGQQSLDDDSDLMEVDDKCNSNVYSPDYKNQKYNNSSTAENFKRFWSEKKRNISSNLKSFFSKSLSPSTSLNSSDTNQKLFISTPPKPVTPVSEASVLKRPQNTITTYVSSDRKQRSFVSSSPQESRFRKPFPIKGNTSPLQNSSLSWQQMSPITSPQTLQNASHQKSKENVQSPVFTADDSTSSEKRIQGSGLSTPGSSFQNTSFDSLERLTIDILPNSSPNEVLNFQLAHFLTVCIGVGDLSEQSTVGIVNWTDGGLTHTLTTCSQKIAAKAGALMRAACSDYIENKGSDLEAPDVLTTPAGGQFDRSVEALLHVVAPPWIEGAESINKRALLEVYTNCLRFADERLGFDSISFPLIGEDYFPVDVCIEAFFDSLLVYLGEHTSSSPPKLTFIHLITPNATIAQFAADFIVPRLNENAHIPGSIASGENSSTVSFLATHSPATCNSAGRSPAQNSRDRAPSGRLRVKRPRL